MKANLPQVDAAMHRAMDHLALAFVLPGYRRQLDLAIRLEDFAAKCRAMAPEHAVDPIPLIKQAVHLACVTEHDVTYHLDRLFDAALSDIASGGNGDIADRCPCNRSPQCTSPLPPCTYHMDTWA
jgi:hypothetical protein